MKYLVLKPFFKLSDRRNYSIDEVIELSKEDAQAMLKDKFLEEVKENKTPYEKSKEGTKGIVFLKTIEEADTEIKEANKKIQDTDND
jgi:beta-lactam-binding protein with PASTA domain